MLSSTTEVQLLRIIQETLTNVRKYAEARHARVMIKINGNLVDIRVEDDGRGFDLAVATDNTSLLSAQQVDILRLVAQGLTYKKIGSRLYLSEVTVKYHMRKIMSLLYLENRAQVIAYALESGLVIPKEQ